MRRDICQANITIKDQGDDEEEGDDKKHKHWLEFLHWKDLSDEVVMWEQQEL